MKIGAFCVCAGNYIDPAIIAIDSFLRYNSEIPVRVYIEDGLNYKRLKGAFREANVEFIPAEFPQLPEHEITGGKYSDLFFNRDNLLSFAQRICGFQELKSEADIIINFDLDTLTLAGFTSAPWMRSPAGMYGVNERLNRNRWQKGLGISDFADMPDYINSGFLACTTDVIPDDLLEKYRAFLRKYGPQLYCPEQDFINFEFLENIKNIPPAYNLMFTERKYTSTAPIMLHFIGSDKPWTPMRIPGPAAYYFRLYYHHAKQYAGIVDAEFLRQVRENAELV